MRSTDKELRQPEISWYKVETQHADAWVASDGQPDTDYSYGGTRTVAFDTSDADTVEILSRLAIDESQLKNRLINMAVEEGVLNNYASRLPVGFINSRVGGGRCVIRPRDKHVAGILAHPGHPEFESFIRPIFARIGEHLNDLDGKVKLTPDFGKFAGLADLLYEYTPHVLGIGRAQGGCGGKSSFSSTGVIAAFEILKPDLQAPITLIGSDGVMGSEFFEYLKNSRYRNVAVSDIAYGGSQDTVEGYPVLESRVGTFTTACLSRGGSIIANTWGNELENADIDVLLPGTLLLLAHNHSVPAGDRGSQLMRTIADRDVIALPGQVLTLGGALTSRLEWFSRQANPGELFDKPLAHDVVRTTVRFLVQRCTESAGLGGTTPYEAMLAAV